MKPIDLSTIKMHDVISIVKRQKTDADGHKLGYSFYDGTMETGVVLQISESAVRIKRADASEYSFNADREEVEYSYEVVASSEYDYLKKIEDEIENKKKKVIDAEKDLHAVINWRLDFKNEISFMSKLLRLVGYLK